MTFRKGDQVTLANSTHTYTVLTVSVTGVLLLVQREDGHKQYIPSKNAISLSPEPPQWKTFWNPAGWNMHIYRGEERDDQRASSSSNAGDPE